MCGQQQYSYTPNSTAARRNWRRRPHASCRLDYQCSGDREEEEGGGGGEGGGGEEEEKERKEEDEVAEEEEARSGQCMHGYIVHGQDLHHGDLLVAMAVLHLVVRLDWVQLLLIQEYVNGTE